jgi:hypothetical protein
MLVANTPFETPIVMYTPLRARGMAFYPPVPQCLTACLVVRVPGYRTEMYCVSCEVRTEFIYVMRKKIDRLCV